MAQGFARMALWIEPEILIELFQSPPDHRNVFRRDPQRFAGPQTGVHADAGDLSVFMNWNDRQIERHPAVNRRLALGLGHQRVFAAFLQIAHGAEAAAFST